MVGVPLSPLLLAAVSFHVSVMSTYHYVQSPVLGLFAAVVSLLDIVLLIRRLVR
jgi:hypothetical protein